MDLSPCFKENKTFPIGKLIQNKRFLEKFRVKIRELSLRNEAIF